MPEFVSVLPVVSITQAESAVQAVLGELVGVEFQPVSRKPVMAARRRKGLRSTFSLAMVETVLKRYIKNKIY